MCTFTPTGPVLPHLDCFQRIEEPYAKDLTNVLVKVLDGESQGNDS